MSTELIETPYAFQALLGFEVKKWSDGFCQLSLPVHEQLGNRHGIPHGGVFATLLDTAMGYAVCYTGDPDLRQYVLTLSLNVNFLAIARDGVLIAEGRKTGGGQKTAFAEANVRDRNGLLIATATGVFKYRRQPEGKIV